MKFDFEYSKKSETEELKNGYCHLKYYNLNNIFKFNPILSRYDTWKKKIVLEYGPKKLFDNQNEEF